MNQYNLCVIVRKISVHLYKIFIMTPTREKQNKVRFDTRLSAEQKQFFERAAILGGYRNLTDFVISAAQSKAREIIEEREALLASEKDQEIFFKALMNPPLPNSALISARQDYGKLISE